MKPSNEGSRLHVRTDVRFDPDAAAAHDALIQAVFGLDVDRTGRPADPAWIVSAYFDRERCVAAIETAVLETLDMGRPSSATAIRLAGVAEAYRGQGLFRGLMQHALTWCEAQTTGPTLLFTEDEALYARFEFRPLPQHAFVGPAPPAEEARPATLVDAGRAAQLLDRLLPVRAPLSEAFTILNAGDLLRANLREDPDLVLAYAEHLDALIVFEIEGDTLVVVDVIAATIPSMAQIVGALATGCGRVRTLFAPERLDWHGAPESEDTGLMIRGPLTAALRRPFMIPPTLSF